MSKVVKCMRCQRRMRPGAKDFEFWNIQYRKGVIVGLLCPDCQIPEEYAEAEMNLAISDYSTMRQDAFGRWQVGLKTEAQR